MFLVALLLLILLLILAGLIVALNYGVLLSTDIHFTLLSWHSPGIPVLLLCLLSAFLGGLVLYVIAARSARRDLAELKKLRARVEELEALQAKSSGPVPAASPAGFAPSAVPLPAFTPQGPSGAPNQPGPVQGGSSPNHGGPLGPGPNPWSMPSHQPPNMSPSASGNTLALPPRLFAPQPPPSPPQQMGGPRPPFPQS